MFQNHTVTVVVPAYNEERLIGRTVSTMPAFVDHIVVVDDVSQDGTVQCARHCPDSRVEIIQRRENGGVGAAIVTGYKESLRRRSDLTVVMAGDAQMDPDDLENLLLPVVNGDADYAKGMRLDHPDVKTEMPLHRYWGNRALTYLTRLATGFWQLTDPQCGYTVISLPALAELDLDTLYPRYGFPNDILCQLAQKQMRVVDVPVRPVYGEAVSNIRLCSYIPTVSALLFRGMLRRILGKFKFGRVQPAGSPGVTKSN